MPWRRQLSGVNYEQEGGQVLLPETSATRVAVGFPEGRDRTLLTETLGDYCVTSIGETVPEGTDICLVAAEEFDTHETTVEAWKERQQPVIAPVLVLATSETGDPWNRFGEMLGRSVDSILVIPASRQELRARIDGLLAVRQHSLVASKRYERLELYERAMDNANIGISIADARADDEPLIYVNEGFVELTGYTLPDVLGRNCRFLQGEGTDPDTVTEIRTALREERPVSVVIRNYRKDGEPFWNMLDIVPVYDESMRVTHYLGFQQDVTERKERQQLLEQYRHVFESVSDPVVVIDEATRVLHANAAAQAVFGLTFDEKTVARVTDLLPEDAARTVRRACRIVTETGRPIERELTVDTRTGHQRTFQVKFERESISDAEGEHVIAVARDISAIREQQGQLTVLDRVLRHNIRNKLTVVSGRAEYMANHATELGPGEITEAANAIDAAAGELLRLVDAIRQFHIGEEVDDSDHQHDVAALVGTMVEGLRSEYSTVEFTVETPEGVVAVCPPQLEVCLEMLTEYAVRESDDDRPTVGIRITDTDGRPVELAVSLSGTTFTEMELEVLSSGSENQLEHTQGIRLWLVKWAVEKVGGTFAVGNDGTDGVVRLGLQRTRSER